MPPDACSVGYRLRNTLSAVLWIGLLWSTVTAGDKEAPTATHSTPSLVMTPGSTKESSLNSKSSSSAAGGLLHSVLAQKGRLTSQKGAIVPSALPQNLLPLLGRGLSISSLPGSHSPEHQNGGLLSRVKPPASAAVSGRGSGPTEPPASDTHSLLPHTQTHSLEQDTEIPTQATMLDMGTETPSSAVSSCMVNFSDPEGYIDSSEDPPLPDSAFVHCTYTVTVYTGYGVELQVKSVNLSEGEQLSIRGMDQQGSLLVLANQTLLVEGQVIRSPTNTLSVYYRSALEGTMGIFQLHYQIFRLSCPLPKRPHFGEVSVLDLLPGGTARFHCHMGYHLQGEMLLTCLNASLPVWSSKEPSCRALCGGTIKNATVGRVLSPSPHHGPNATQDRSCSWSLEAPKDQRLHLHLERLEKTTTIYSTFGGKFSVFSFSPPAFERGHCYEPYLQNGNFTTSDPLYGVGAVVQFTCDPGHSLEQGPPVIECISARDPYWNDTEPLCKAQCGGDLTGPGGVILSPNWPEWYGEGEDCSWRIHVGEDKRVLLDVQLLNISDSDMLTITDGDEVTTRILGRYVGGSSPFKLSSTTPDLTVTFHSDPAGLVFGKGEGFIINYMEVSRNDSCPDLPEIQNGWKTTSHIALVRGARITYQCDPGYDLVGWETLTCQLDLSWSSQPPFCEKIMYCSDPGHVEHSTRSLSDPKLLVGTTIQYSCNAGFILQGSATITCYGREPGTPVWTSRLPHCVSNHDCFGNHALEEATAGSSLDGGNIALAIFILVLLLSVLLGGAYVYVTRCRYNSNLRLPLIYPHPYRQITVETEFDNPLYETGGDTREYEVSI
uniref:Seizure related 6 homolog (mouse)-like n=1 Tax=Anabas testudineus TaxID=64144 RepID=A0A7N6A6N0_ANATE